MIAYRSIGLILVLFVLSAGCTEPPDKLTSSSFENAEDTWNGDIQNPNDGIDGTSNTDGQGDATSGDGVTNTDDATGQGTTDGDATTPVDCEKEPQKCDTEIPHISAGPNFTCAVIKNQVQCWGSNSAGQMGVDVAVQTSSPTVVNTVQGPLLGATSVTAGQAYACALVEPTGDIWCWGKNGSGQLGRGETTNTIVAAPVLGIGDGGGPGDALTQMKDVSAGADHTCAIDHTGGVWCWGGNSEGQLGLNESNNAYYAQKLGLPGTVGPVVDIAVGNAISVAVTEVGDVLQWGKGMDSESQPMGTLDFGTGLKATKAAVGNDLICVLFEDGSVRCKGDNTYGQLGYGGDVSETNGSNEAVVWEEAPQTPLLELRDVSVVNRHVCVHNASGNAYCWGLNNWGQLGNTGVKAAHKSMAMRIDLSDVSAITAGKHHTCAVKEGNAIYCWGVNHLQQLGVEGQLTVKSPVLIAFDGTGVSAVDYKDWGRFSVGGDHTCAMVSGQVNCWGRNSTGQLGDGALLPRYKQAPMVKDKGGVLKGIERIFAGTSHTCLLTAQDTALCVGSNTHGQLGNAEIQEPHVTVAQTVYESAGIALDKIEQMAVGDEHSCAMVNGIETLKVTRKIWCWGNNDQGQLGISPQTLSQSATPQELAVDARVIDYGSALVAGSDHTCALNNVNEIMCWGRNDLNQLGAKGDVDAGTLHRVPQKFNCGDDNECYQWKSVSSLAAGGNTTCVVNGGEVRCWGANTDEQLQIETASYYVPVLIDLGVTDDAYSVALGDDHACALAGPAKTELSVYCWGSNVNGQLGMNTATAVAPPQLVPNTVTGPRLLSAGGQQTCMFQTQDKDTMNKGMYCWGNNEYGQQAVPLAFEMTPQSVSFEPN